MIWVKVNGPLRAMIGAAYSGLCLFRTENPQYPNLALTSTQFSRQLDGHGELARRKRCRGRVYGLQRVAASSLPVFDGREDSGLTINVR